MSNVQKLSHSPRFDQCARFDTQISIRLIFHLDSVSALVRLQSVTLEA